MLEAGATVAIADAEFCARFDAVACKDTQLRTLVVVNGAAGDVSPTWRGWPGVEFDALAATGTPLVCVLMTGRHVASGPEGAERLLKWLREVEPGLELAVAPWADLAEITGAAGWEPRRYVPLITRFHAEGGSRCLIGTRALLGEGWDAPAVNVVIDLTAATTPTSVVQARGRAGEMQLFGDGDELAIGRYRLFALEG